ncbi:MAG TPA: hypothetical protein VHY08_10785, partial [Bacillota bacterium]|nr:hypothetical protein [Bacillota bacterium]
RNYHGKTSRRSASGCTSTDPMTPVRFLQPAEQEMLNTARYYEMQTAGLGEDFLLKSSQQYVILPKIQNDGQSSIPTSGVA